MILFIGTAEIVFIVFIVLLLFGSKKIPEVARALGKGIREFQKATEDIKREISRADITVEDEKSKNAVPSDKRDEGDLSHSQPDNQ